MRFKLGLTAPLAVAVFLVGILACGQDATVAAPAGLKTPNIQATVTALALSQARALTPTPLPEGARQKLQAFAAGHKSTSADWDRFRQDMDQWRSGAVVCLPASVESALDAFARSALGVTQTARSLDRLPSLEGLANALAAAAERESAAFELLSNNWRPETGLSSQAPSQTPGSFQQFESVRSSVALERGKVARSLKARQTSVDGASLTAIEAFASDVKILEADWDQFHRDYDAFRVEQVQLGDDAAAERLGDLVTQLAAIVDSVRNLPDTPLTREIADQLADAADGEQLLLRRLLGSIGGDGALITVEAIPVLPDELAITGTGNGGTGSLGVALDGATVFDVFDTQIALVNRLRRALGNELRDARASLTESGQADLAVFLWQTRALDREWDDFHDSYDDWRRTNGGCDQAQALEALGRLAQKFSQTVRDVKDLSSFPLVREMGEQLIQAVEREQAAVLSLRESWRSLDTSAFARYTAERAFADSLRRQVDLHLQDLLERQGLSSGG